MEENIMDLQNKKPDEVYCFACGSIIKKKQKFARNVVSIKEREKRQLKRRSVVTAYI